ncbi:MAG: CPBP family intramembrane metalloprotease [Bacteroides sp.]|nr:CPBP family intramembrane metalloprotease [Bacteroides sp.]
MKEMIRKYQVAIFSVSNLAVTFILLVILDIDYIPQWMPGVSALFLTGFVLRRKGVNRIMRRLIVRKQDFKWYLPATLIPFIACLIVYLLLDFMEVIPSLVNLPTPGFREFTVVPAMILVGSIGEEIGWRGYMLPELLQRNSFLKSNIIIGVIWGVWHCMFDAGFPVFCMYIVYCIETSVLIAWLCRKTGNRIVVAILYHTTINLCGWIFFEGLFITDNYPGLCIVFGFQGFMLAFPCLYILRKSSGNLP